MPKTSGIYRKLVKVFVLQMLFISAITVLGVYIAATIVEKVMIKTALEGEAIHYWNLLQQDPNHPTPDTDNLMGYIAKQGDYRHVPASLKAVPLGFRRISFEGRHPIVYVEEKQGDRLFLVFDEQSVGKLSFYFGVVPLSLALMVIYVSAWLAYRWSKNSLSPLVSLAQTVRDFDVRRDQPDALKLEGYNQLALNDEARILADSLQEFTQRLKRQLERERAFTRDVSHELRTPLAVIRGSLELLEKQAQEPLQRRVIERMQSTSDDMLSLIETLLLLAREENHAAEENVLVNELAAALLEQVTQTHHLTQQQVRLQLKAEYHLVVQAPRQVLNIVLGNLLQNACNYTPKGSVTVHIQADAVEVCDTGLGMSEAEIIVAQQAFERLPKTQEKQGYGLGLDIVKRLCERYQWQLSIQSQPQQGTCVKVRFAPAQINASQRL
ncbi:HAMP domain-containing sensor histidine kinase [uncultured Thiothrix sp.]|uniref:sensor histidine kinase n=1 Tax=uncultured Thiothrix sp. TaxID=223185 RepID=UPI0026307DE9|nr:HAMP domain-containing sensor histidine kinase [uncultured Thiothrix sp.]